MSSAAAQARNQQAAARAASSNSQPKSSIGPRLIGGVGAAVTLAAVATVVALSSPSTSTRPVSQVETAYSNPAPAVGAEVATTAAVSAVPAIAVAPPAPPPVQTYSPAPVPPQTQCSLIQRKFYVAGNGIIRIRDGDFVSTPVELGPYPQVVLMDLPRPANGFSAPETIVVEGRATTVVMTSDLPGFQKVINRLRGTSSFGVQWAPLKNC
jgi:hypothetical protein